MMLINSEYNNLLTMIQIVLKKHAPLKSKIIRGNQAPFMNKELSKAIMRRSQLKTKYNKAKQEADRNAYKKQQNLCVKLRRKAVKQYFVNKCRSGIMSNKNFWKTVKPFISNKTKRNQSDIILIENNNIINPIQAGVFWNHIGWGEHISPHFPPFLLYLLSDHHQTWHGNTIAQNLSKTEIVKSIMMSYLLF